MGQMGIEGMWVWDKWTFGGKDTLEQRGVLGPMNIGTNGHLGKWAVWSKWWREEWGNVLRCRGTGKEVGMCVVVWGQVRESVSGGV